MYPTQFDETIPGRDLVFALIINITALLLFEYPVLEHTKTKTVDSFSCPTATTVNKLSFAYSRKIH